MDTAATIETTFARVLKLRGFRKRSRSWFRMTSAGEYQVVNLQKSEWGHGNFYLNLGWDPAVPAAEFRPAHKCVFRLRAEHTDVIPTIQHTRADGITALELPGISLLDLETRRRIPEDVLATELDTVIVIPIADLLDRTPSIIDLVPLLTAKPWFVTLALRDELGRRGHQLPTSW